MRNSTLAGATRAPQQQQQLLRGVRGAARVQSCPPLALRSRSSSSSRRSVVRMGGPAPVVAPKMQDAGDPFGLLLQQRIVFLGSEVNDFTADAVVSQLLLLDAQDPTKDIKLFINSPGGSVTAGMGIYDAIKMCRCDVSTVCFGLAASMGAFLLMSGITTTTLT